MPKRRLLNETMDTDPDGETNYSDIMTGILDHICWFTKHDGLGYRATLSQIVGEQIPVFKFATTDDKAKLAASLNDYIKTEIPTYAVDQPTGWRKLNSILEVHLTDDLSAELSKIDAETADEWSYILVETVRLRNKEMSMSQVPSTIAESVLPTNETQAPLLLPKKTVKITVSELPVSLSYKWPTPIQYETELASLTQVGLRPDHMVYETEIREGESEFDAYLRAMQEVSHLLAVALNNIRFDMCEIRSKETRQIVPVEDLY